MIGNHAWVSRADNGEKVRNFRVYVTFKFSFESAAEAAIANSSIVKDVPIFSFIQLFDDLMNLNRIGRSTRT